VTDKLLADAAKQFVCFGRRVLSSVSFETWREQMSAHIRGDDDVEPLMTTKETAAFLRVSESWLVKARMRRDGPPFIQIGRSVRYSKPAVLRWLKSQAH
jgi:predicted DNA-binding transcriptional regulator AlpA